MDYGRVPNEVIVVTEEALRNSPLIQEEAQVDDTPN